MLAINKSKSVKSLGTALAMSAMLLAGSLSTSLTPAFAEAVRVTAPQAPSFADAVEAVSPAVVSVRVEMGAEPASQRQSSRSSQDFLPEGHPLRRFFENDRGNRRGFGDRRRGRNFGASQGSGFFVSDDGYIVTNNHVVENGPKFTIVQHDGTELDAKLIGTDPKTDLAVLKVDAKEKFTYVAFSEEKSRVGEWVVAVGNPFGLGGTVTAGIVSASGRDIGSGPYDDFLQIDAAVNKGNSGGPAFNLKGEVIGVNTAIFSPSGGNVGIAFAISASSASAVVNDLIKNGVVSRGWLGVQIQPVTRDIADSLGLDKAAGAIVAEAQDKSPAALSGVETGDIIVKVDEQSIKDSKQLAKVIAGYGPDANVKLTVIRDGKEQGLDVKLGTLPGAKKVALKNGSRDNDAEFKLAELGVELTNTPDGVVIAGIERGSPASDKNLRRGDVVLSVNGTDIKSVDDVSDAVAEAISSERKAVLLQVESQNRNRFVALPLDLG
jgi:serine protease Do